MSLIAKNGYTLTSLNKQRQRTHGHMPHRRFIGNEQEYES